MSEVTYKLKEINLNWNSPNVFLMILDGSGSMREFESSMRSKLNYFSEQMAAMDEAGSVIISKVIFSDDYNQSAYDSIENYDSSYCASGGTELYETIYKTGITLIGSEGLEDYDGRVSEGAVPILQDLGYEPKFTIIVFSDGCDNNRSNSNHWKKKAKAVIERINELGGVTAFVCFGDDISKEVAEELGFKNIDTKCDLDQAFEAISSSCIRQSQSSVSITDGFFDNN